MTNQLEQCIFISFHTKNQQYPVLLRSLKRLGISDPIDHLAGVHGDTEGIFSIFSIPVDKNFKDSLKLLQSIFLKTSDFHPAISENPSEAHASAARKLQEAHKQSQQAALEELQRQELQDMGSNILPETVLA